MILPVISRDHNGDKGKIVVSRLHSSHHSEQQTPCPILCKSRFAKVGKDLSIIEIFPNPIGAKEKSIPWQTCGGIPGRTDAAALQCTKAGVRTATLAVPVRYHHTPSGLISLGDADGVLALTRALLDELAKKE